MTLGGVGISMVGRNPGSPSVASAVPQSYDGSVCRVPVLPAAWREADYETTDLEKVIQDLLTGQYGNQIRAVAFTHRALVGRCFRGRRSRIAPSLRSAGARESKGTRDPIGVN